MRSKANAMSLKHKPKRIGLYVRVSTEEQTENPEGSVKNQEERLRQMVHFKNMDQNFGEIVDVYIDAGKSGKDTNRPQLQRLLSAIRKNEVNLIMTTELSRISRSIKDFSEIWEMMQEYGCGLLCLRENFDSSNAAGEMVMFMLANFAQFERRQISERVSANIKVRSGRGLYNGGPVPAGYKLIPDKKGYLAIDEEQAAVVRKCFEAFLRERSLSDTARWLNENGYRLRREMQGGGNFRAPQFSIDKLHKILRQSAYAGIKLYHDRGEEKEVKAVWEPIVDREIFDRVQEILTKNYSRNKPLRVKKYAYLLSGILRCKVCGESLCGKMATGHSNRFFYYL